MENQIIFFGLDLKVKIPDLDKMDSFIRLLSKNHSFWSNRNPHITTINEFGIPEVIHLPYESQILCDGCSTIIEDDFIYISCYIDDGMEYISRAECKECIDEYYNNIPIIRHGLIEKLYDSINKNEPIIINEIKIGIELDKLLILIYENIPDWRIKEIYANNPIENMIKYAYSVVELNDKLFSSIELAEFLLLNQNRMVNVLLIDEIEDEKVPITFTYNNPEIFEERTEGMECFYPNSDKFIKKFQQYKFQIIPY